MCISSPEKNSWSVIYRKNSGEDINITSLTFKNSLLAARTLMVPENYMICILRNGERVRRWDREILAIRRQLVLPTRANYTGRTLQCDIKSRLLLPSLSFSCSFHLSVRTYIRDGSAGLPPPPP